MTNIINEQIRVNLDVLTPSQSVVDLAVRFPIYVINEYHTVQSDWEQDDTSAGDYIKNKPDLNLKADKVIGATNGNFASLDNNGNIADSGRSVEKVDNNDNSNLPTLNKVNALIEAMPEPMLFKGSLGTGGTITTLPIASSSNEGFTYKVITAGTYAEQTAKVGDTFISDGTQWILIPSGDEPSGTVTSIKINATSPINIDNSTAITTSGERTISHANSGATAGSYGDSAAQTPSYGDTFKVPYVTVNATGHVTEISEHTVKIPASDNTDTHRPIQMDGTEILGNNTTALNLKAGNNVTLSNSSGTVTIASSDSTKADKVSSATSGNFAGLDANGNLTDSGKKAADFQVAGSYKTTQTAKADPTASGNTITAIDTITQDANGEITATKKTIRSATTSQNGLVQLSNSYNGTSQTVAVTEKALSDGLATKQASGSYKTTQTAVTDPSVSGTSSTSTQFISNITQDANGVISPTKKYIDAIRSLSVSGQTITVTHANTIVESITTQDTKNTAGSTDTSSKIYLVGATSQAANPQTYSDNEVYAQNGLLEAKEVQVNEAAKWVWDSVNQCLKVVFN